MSPIRRLLTLLSLGILVAGATACTGPRASASPSGGTLASSSVGGASTTQGKLLGAPGKGIATPIVVMIAGGPRPTLTPNPSGVFGQGALSAPSGQAGLSGLPGLPLPGASSLRLPADLKSLVMVQSTDGEGLWVRREPAGEAIRTWPDATPMFVTGEDQVADERVWRPVRTLDGQTGWAAADYLVPADEQTIAAAQQSLTPPLPTNVQARVAVTDPTPTAAPAAPPAPTATTAPRRPVSFAGQGGAPTATIATVASAQATATPQPTATAQPTATPVRAPAGATSMEVGSSVLSILSTDRGMPIKIGSRPRAGMELAAVQVKISNNGNSPLPVYRGTFRLSLSDRSRLEPLAGGESPMPYSTSVAPGETFEGWLTFEAPTGTRMDSLIWSPERDVSYAVGI